MPEFSIGSTAPFASRLAPTFAMRPPCGSEPARESNRSNTAESGTNKNGSPTGLPLIVYR
nr:hypothetical protein FEE99_08370 [Pseudomonas sp. ef1]